MVSLKDIAARTGLSLMTVSKALRDAPEVAATTRERVKQVAAELGYVPNTLARALRTRTTKFFGLLLPTITNPFHARIVVAIEERAFGMGYDVILAHSLGLVEREDACLERFVSRGVEGVFLAPVYRLAAESRGCRLLLERQIPTVILGPVAQFCQTFPNVETDDLHGSYELTRHLLELGHRRILFLAGPTGSPVARERLEGYRRALRDAEIEVDDRLILVAGSTTDDGTQAGQQLLAEPTDATAIQAVNDQVAVGCAHVLLAHGIRIPADLSLGGFGNIAMGEHFRVPLTTVHQSKFKLGQAAMDAMMALKQGQRPDTTRLPTRLIVRESTAPPPATPPLLKPRAARSTA